MHPSVDIIQANSQQPMARSFKRADPEAASRRFCLSPPHSLHRSRSRLSGSRKKSTTPLPASTWHSMLLKKEKKKRNCINLEIYLSMASKGESLREKGVRREECLVCMLGCWGYPLSRWGVLLTALLWSLAAWLARCEANRVRPGFHWSLWAFLPPIAVPVMLVLLLRRP